MAGSSSVDSVKSKGPWMPESLKFGMQSLPNTMKLGPEWLQQLHANDGQQNQSQIIKNDLKLLKSSVGTETSIHNSLTEIGTSTLIKPRQYSLKLMIECWQNVLDYAINLPETLRVDENCPDIVDSCRIKSKPIDMLSFMQLKNVQQAVMSNSKRINPPADKTITTSVSDKTTYPNVVSSCVHYSSIDSGTVDSASIVSSNQKSNPPLRPSGSNPARPSSLFPSSCATGSSSNSAANSVLKSSKNYTFQRHKSGGEEMMEEQFDTDSYYHNKSIQHKGRGRVLTRSIGTGDQHFNRVGNTVASAASSNTLSRSCKSALNTPIGAARGPAIGSEGDLFTSEDWRTGPEIGSTSVVQFGSVEGDVGLENHNGRQNHFNQQHSNPHYSHQQSQASPHWRQRAKSGSLVGAEKQSSCNGIIIQNTSGNWQRAPRTISHTEEDLVLESFYEDEGLPGQAEAVCLNPININSSSKTVELSGAKNLDSDSIKNTSPSMKSCSSFSGHQNLPTSVNKSPNSSENTSVGEPVDVESLTHNLQQLVAATNGTEMLEEMLKKLIPAALQSLQKMGPEAMSKDLFQPGISNSSSLEKNVCTVTTPLGQPQQSTIASISSPPPGMEVSIPRNMGNPTQPAWYYIDPKGKQHGPYQNAEMSHWLSSGYFTSNLKLRRDFDCRFLTLEGFKKLYGSANPFVDLVVHPAGIPDEANEYFFLSNDENLPKTSARIFHSELLPNSFMPPVCSPTEITGVEETNIWSSEDNNLDFEPNNLPTETIPTAEPILINSKFTRIKSDIFDHSHEEIWEEGSFTKSSDWKSVTHHAPREKSEKQRSTNSKQKTSISPLTNIYSNSSNAEINSHSSRPIFQNAIPLQQTKDFLQDRVLPSTLPAPWASGINPSNSIVQNPVSLTDIQAQEQAELFIANQIAEEKRLAAAQESASLAASAGVWGSRDPKNALELTKAQVMGCAPRSLAKIQAEEEQLEAENLRVKLRSQMDSNISQSLQPNLNRSNTDNSLWSTKVAAALVNTSPPVGQALVPLSTLASNNTVQATSPRPVLSIWGPPSTQPVKSKIPPSPQLSTSNILSDKKLPNIDGINKLPNSAMKSTVTETIGVKSDSNMLTSPQLPSSPSLVEWAKEAVQSLVSPTQSRVFDISTLIEITSDLHEDSDVQEILQQYLGDSAAVRQFSSEFLKRRHSSFHSNVQSPPSGTPLLPHSSQPCSTITSNNNNNNDSINSSEANLSATANSTWQTAGSRTTQNNRRKKKPTKHK